MTSFLRNHVNHTKLLKAAANWRLIQFKADLLESCGSEKTLFFQFQWRPLVTEFVKQEHWKRTNPINPNKAGPFEGSFFMRGQSHSFHISKRTTPILIYVNHDDIKGYKKAGWDRWVN